MSLVLFFNSLAHRTVPTISLVCVCDQIFPLQFFSVLVGHLEASRLYAFRILFHTIGRGRRVYKIIRSLRKHKVWTRHRLLNYNVKWTVVVVILYLKSPDLMREIDKVWDMEQRNRTTRLSVSLL